MTAVLMIVVMAALKEKTETMAGLIFMTMAGTTVAAEMNTGVIGFKISPIYIMRKPPCIKQVVFYL
jgi:hypothetical protein